MALGNPAPLGLLAFGMTTCLLMSVDMSWSETESQDLVCCYALFFGGMLQVLVAIFELIKGSSFSFAVFGSYGAFWLGWALVYLENHSVTSEFGSVNYTTGSTIWLVQWGLLTCCFLIIAIRKNICLITILTLLALTFFLLAAAVSTGNVNVRKAAGYFGFFTAIAAWYTGIAELVNEDRGRNLLPGLEPISTPERDPVTKENITEQRTSYDAKSNTLLLQFRGMNIKTTDDVQAIKDGVETAIYNSKAPNHKVHAVIDYENVVIADDVSREYWEMVSELERSFYLSAKRFHVTSFGTPPGVPSHSSGRFKVYATQNSREVFLY